MKKLKIVKIDDFDEYTLEDDEKNQHFFCLGFYDMPKLGIGDTLYLDEVEQKFTKFCAFSLFCTTKTR